MFLCFLAFWQAAVVSALLQALFGSAYGGNFSIHGGLSVKYLAPWHSFQMGMQAHPPVSLPAGIKAAALTCLYFAVIFFLSLSEIQRKLNRMKLISLLYYERHNETPYVKNAVSGRVLLIGSVMTGTGSGLIFYFQPLVNYWGSG